MGRLTILMTFLVDVDTRENLAVLSKILRLKKSRVIRDLINREYRRLVKEA